MLIWRVTSVADPRGGGLGGLTPFRGLFYFACQYMKIPADLDPTPLKNSCPELPPPLEKFVDPPLEYTEILTWTFVIGTESPCNDFPTYTRVFLISHVMFGADICSQRNLSVDSLDRPLYKLFLHIFTRFRPVLCATHQGIVHILPDSHVRLCQYK